MNPLFLSLFQLKFFFVCLTSICFGSVVGALLSSRGKYINQWAFILTSLSVTVFTFISRFIVNVNNVQVVLGAIILSIAILGASMISQSKRINMGFEFIVSLWILTGVSVLIGLGQWILGVVITLMLVIIVSVKLLFFSIRGENREYHISLNISKFSSLETLDDMVNAFELNITNRAIVKNDDLHIELSYLTTPLRHHLFLKKAMKLKGVGVVFSN